MTRGERAGDKESARVRAPSSATAAVLRDDTDPALFAPDTVGTPPVLALKVLGPSGFFNAAVLDFTCDPEAVGRPPLPGADGF
jgi:hypothetical protein